jgi:signal transduction histidine kinase
VSRVPPAADVSALWLETLQRLADRAAHEIKGALNGVALNVEVVRSRTAKAGADVGAVAPYATAAHQQMESLTTLTESLLSLARPVRGRCDLGVLLGRFADLAAPIAREGGGELRIGALPGAGDAMVQVAPDAARLALGAAMLAALEAPARASIDVRMGDPVLVTLRRDGDGPVRLPAEITAVLADAGIRVEQHGDGLGLAFVGNGGAANGEP